jgi:hypothetical protein
MVTSSAVAPQRDSPAVSFGAIGASAAGGALLVLIVVGVVCCAFRRGRRRRQRDDATLASQLTLSSSASGAFPTPPQNYGPAPSPDILSVAPAVYGESSLSST